MPSGCGVVFCSCSALFLAGLYLAHRSSGSTLDRVQIRETGSVGGGRACRTPGSARQAVEAFYLAGMFFRAPRPPELASSWNRFGFWRRSIDTPSSNHYEQWVGVPGWLPAALLGLLAVGLLNRAHKRHAQAQQRAMVD